MDEDLVLFYLNKIESKVKTYALQRDEILRNDLLMYLETCIEVCNLIEKRFYKKVDKYKSIFEKIQGYILLKNTTDALKELFKQKKELESSGKVSSSKV